MKFFTSAHRPDWPFLAWSTVFLAGFAAPVWALLMLQDSTSSAPLTSAGGPILSLALMGVGMIGAAATGRLWMGIVLALVNGMCLIMLAHYLGMPTPKHPQSAALAMIIASVSFAARGALFGRSALSKGWLIAVFVVAGEAAILITSAVKPGLWPDWILVLLPAQWASLAFQMAITGTGAGISTLAANAVLLALAGTAMATLLVTMLLPRRWPYLVMFTTWLAMSALVWHWQAPPNSTDDPAMAAALHESGSISAVFLGAAPTSFRP